MSNEKATPFNPVMPKLYSKSWREAYRHQSNEHPRLSRYTAPGGTAISFILESDSVRGGHSVDTKEYPFQGMWSNVTLNEKPQELSVKGYVRGENYLGIRNALIEAFRVPTSDDNPGTLDMPLWGEWPVIIKSWQVQENAKAGGQCEIDLEFTRTGYSETKRDGKEMSSGVSDNSARETAHRLANIILEDEQEFDTDIFTSNVNELVDTLNSILGEIEGIGGDVQQARSTISQLTNLSARATSTLKKLARAIVSIASTVAEALISVKDSEENASDVFTARVDYVVRSTFSRLIAAKYTEPDPRAITPFQVKADNVARNFKKVVSLFAANRLLSDLPVVGRNRVHKLWVLYTSLEDSIDKSNPDLYRLVESLRSDLNIQLTSQHLQNEKKYLLYTPMPLLSLGHELGDTVENMRELNHIPDSLHIQGELFHV